MKTTAKLLALLATVFCLAACEPEPIEPPDRQQQEVVDTIPDPQPEPQPQQQDCIFGRLDYVGTVTIDGECIWRWALITADTMPLVRNSNFISDGWLAFQTLTIDSVTYQIGDYTTVCGMLYTTYDDYGYAVHALSLDSTTAPVPHQPPFPPSGPPPSGNTTTYICQPQTYGHRVIFTLDPIQHRVYSTVYYGIYNPNRVYPNGVFEYRAASEVNTMDAYWLISLSTGDTAGLYLWRPQDDGTLRIYEANNIANYDDFTVTTDWSTYLCTDYDLNLVMHLRYVHDVIYETIRDDAQLSTPAGGHESPFLPGKFNFRRWRMRQPAIGIPYWELTLDYSCYGGGMVTHLYVRGEPFEDPGFVIWRKLPRPVYNFIRIN